MTSIVTPQPSSALIPPHRLSALIGMIYDCAIDPDRWPAAMREICSDLNCALAVIHLVELAQPRLRFVKSWNFDPAKFCADPRYTQDLVTLTRAAPIMTHPIDEPMATARLISRELTVSTRYGREVSLPGGYIDSMQTVVFRNADRIGLFSAVRHESVGFATDDDLAILRLLAPHIRRSITISDLLDLKALEANALAATLDHLAVGVVVVAAENRILHANEAARQMIAEGAPIVARKGRLALCDRAADQELTKAVAIARKDEATIGAAGIAVSIRSGTGEPAVAHVLPLGQGDLRTKLMSQATAAVFVAGPEHRVRFDADALAQAHGLTPAEARVLERLLAGATLGEAAEVLDISPTTVKTHLSRIFAKTGVSRQAELIALVHQMTPPVR